MGYANCKNEGAALDFVVGIAPISNDGTEIASTTVYADRMAAGGNDGFESCKMIAMTGLSSGTPSSFSYPFKLQHSTATGSGWADYTDPSTGSVPTITLTAVSSVGEVAVNLSAANRYLRVHCDGTLAGGSTPAVLIAAGIIMCGSKQRPI